MALPGVKTILQDRFYSLARQDTVTGPRVLAIGTRDTDYDPDNGVLVKDYDPYYATSEKLVIKEFGYGSQLHKAFLELLQGGAQSIYLVALPSDTVDSDLVDESDGNRFDLAFDAAETALPDFIVPYGRGANVHDWDDYASPATPGGHDQFGFVADNSAGDSSLVIRVGNKMQEISSRSQPCLAVMGVKPWVGEEQMTTADVASHIQFSNLLDRNSTINDDADGENTGYYVSVVAAEIRPLGFPPEFGWTNGACHYAAQVSSMAANSAPTNKKLYNVQAIRYSLNRTQREVLTEEKGVVPVGTDYARNPLWVDGTTFGKSTSDYVRLATIRTVFEVIRMVRQVAQPFIGEPANTENRNAFETGLTSGLRSFQLTGGLIGSDFIVTYYPRSSSATVDLVLQTAFELRNINVNVSIQF